MKTRKHKKTFVYLCGIAVPLALAGIFAGTLFRNMNHYSLPADMKKGDEIAAVELIVTVVPTGESILTRMHEGDDIEFRIVELCVTETLKGNASETIRLLQTVGMEENPILRKGQEYLLFLDMYQGPIPQTEGAYVAASAHWSYYSVGDNDTVKPLYDESGEVAEWIAAIANKKSDPGDEVYTIIDWARDASRTS